MNPVHSYRPAEGHRLRHDPLYAIDGPRPIGWIATRDAEGRANLAPYSFFNLFCDEPPIIGFCSNGWKDTVSNAAATREFVWNLATRDLARAMNATSANLAHAIDEFVIAGLTKRPGQVVAAPRVAESPVSFECQVTQIVRLHAADGVEIDAWMVFGEVVMVHIDTAVIVDGTYRTPLTRPILRAGGAGDYVEIRPEAMFRMQHPD